MLAILDKWATCCFRLFGSSVLVSSMLNLLVPVTMKKIGYTATCILRGLQGLSEGVLYPSCYAILRHWSVPQERGRMGAIMLTGACKWLIITNKNLQ